MLSGALSCSISGNAIASCLAGIFVSAVIAAAHIIYHSGANAIGIDSTLRAFFIFFTRAKQQAKHSHGSKNKTFHKR